MSRPTPNFPREGLGPSLFLSQRAVPCFFGFSLDRCSKIARIGLTVINHGMETNQRKNTKSAFPVRGLGALALAVGMLVSMAHGQEEKKKENSLPWELQAVRLIRKEKPESEKELQELLKSEQEKGNKKAGLVLALRLAGGFSGEQNHDEARKIIEPLAAEGDVDAQWLLAYDEMTRILLQKGGNKERVKSLAKNAADQGHHGAQATCAAFDCYSTNEEAKATALKYAKKAAEQGNSYGMNVVARVDVANMKEFEEYDKCLAAWKAGCVQAAGGVGTFMEERSAEFAESGSSFLMYEGMAIQCRKEGDRMNETKWLTLAAEGGNMFAVQALSDTDATGVEKDYRDAFGYEHDNLYFEVNQDLPKAVELYRKAAEGGHVLAMYRLANCYELGRGTERDEKKAEELYRKAAEQKLDIAALRLGQLLLRRGGKAAKEANKWLAQAAEQGNVVAKYTLGLCYLKGKGGVKKSPQRAQSLFMEAAALCDICSKYELGFAAYFAKGSGKDEKQAALETLNHAGMDCGPLCMATPMISPGFGDQNYWQTACNIIVDGRHKTDHSEADFKRVMQGNTNALCLYYLLRDLKLPKKGS